MTNLDSVCTVSVSFFNVGYTFWSYRERERQRETERIRERERERERESERERDLRPEGNRHIGSQYQLLKSAQRLVMN